MNVIDFNNLACQRIQRLLDSYVDNELLVETNHDVLRHLEQCPQCRQALESLLRMKSQLQRAVASSPVPADLSATVQTHLHGSQHNRWSRWAMAAAATIIILIGWQMNATAEIQRILQIGLADHIQCTIREGNGRRTQAMDEIVAPSGTLGPEYASLLNDVQSNAGNGFVIVGGHKCRVDGREYIHIILRNPTELASVIITQKSGEHFPIADLRAIHQRNLDGFETSAFESSRHLMFVVSNSDVSTNSGLATNLQPSLKDFFR